MSIKSWIAERWRPLSFGEQGEIAAARFLRRLGYRIVVTRRKLRYGELDIIAVDGRTVVFVEVKTRVDDEPTPEQQVNGVKQHQLTKTGRFYLSRYGNPQPPARFDIIAVVWPHNCEPQIRHTIGAFEATF